MKISVILPCYNAERYLNACFESLFAQSMRDFEVIFIDDGSLDGSLAIARRCAGRDDRIRVFAQENQGSARRAISAFHMRGANGSRLWMATIYCRPMRSKPCFPARQKTWTWSSAPMRRLTSGGMRGAFGRKHAGIAKMENRKKRGGTPTD